MRALRTRAFVDDGFAVTVDDLDNGRGLAIDASVCERGVCGRHFRGVGVLDAERGGGHVLLQVRLVQSEAGRHFVDRLGRDAAFLRIGERQAHESRVRRDGGHVGDRKRAVVGFAVIIDGVRRTASAFDLHGTVAVHVRGGADALLDGVGKGERFERGADGPAVGAGRDVELVAVPVVLAADHGLDEAR